MKLSSATCGIFLAAIATHSWTQGAPNELPDINAADTVPWKKKNFGNPRIEYLSPPEFYQNADPSSFTHELNLTIVLFRKTGWRIDQIQARLELLAKVYSQCGIKVGSVKLVEANAPHGWTQMDGCHPFKGNRTFKLAELTPETERPILYYVKSTTDESPACAGPRFNVGDSSPMLNTAWMTTLLNADPTLPWNFPQFSDEAHELGHVLLNASHVTSGPPNLMGTPPVQPSNDLTPDQCETMRKSDLLRKL